MATKTKGAPAGRAAHERPCFCGDCAGATVSDLLDELAAILDAMLRDGVCTEDTDRRLAEELITGIPLEARQAVLAQMIEVDHLWPRVMNVDCLLDECDERSYRAVAQMAAVLMAAIHEQHAEGGALLVVVTNEIVHRQELLAFGREEQVRAEAGA
jgi:hypothetical protein